MLGQGFSRFVAFQGFAQRKIFLPCRRVSRTPKVTHVRASQSGGNFWGCDNRRAVLYEHVSCSQTRIANASIQNTTTLQGLLCAAFDGFPAYAVASSCPHGWIRVDGYRAAAGSRIHPTPSLSSK